MSKKFERHFKKYRGLKVIKLYALSLSLPFYIVYPSKMQRQILFDVVIEFMFVIVRFLGQLPFIC